MNAIGRRRWSAALVVALALHGGLALAMAWSGPVSSGAAMPGLAGLEVSLGAAGGTPGAVEAVSAEQVPVAFPAESVTPVQSQPPTETAPVETVVAEEIPVTAVEPEPVETTEPVEPVEQVTAVEPVETVVAEAVMAEPAPVPPSKPEAPQPAPQAPASEVVVAAGTAQGAASDPAAQNDPTAAAGSQSTGSGADTGMDAGDDTPGGGTPGAVADYYALLQAWLERHRRYPDRARERGQEGVAYVFFVLDAGGRVLERRLERSSGYALLDEEVLAMVARADPMPPIPGDMARASLAIVVPVAFTLR